MRRDRIRRNHTATHVLHWALREVLGKQVKQAGSLVSPDRLRFDFSHHEAVTPEQLAEVEALANQQIISDAPVRHYETTKAEAERLGAIAFFGDKYGDIVRVLEAGPSVELCGGTHVHALGFIGPIKIVSEGSVGANLRRIEAVTGDGALARIADEEATLRRLGDRLRAAPAELEDKVDHLVTQVKELNDEVATLRARGEARGRGPGRVADRRRGRRRARDGLSPDELRQLAQATLAALGRGVVALVGLGPDGSKAGIVVAVSADRREAGASAATIAEAAADAGRWGRAATPTSRSAADRRPTGSTRRCGSCGSKPSPGRDDPDTAPGTRAGLGCRSRISPHRSRAERPRRADREPAPRAPARETAGRRPSLHRRRGPRE